MQTQNDSKSENSSENENLELIIPTKAQTIDLTEEKYQELLVQVGAENESQLPTEPDSYDKDGKPEYYSDPDDKSEYEYLKEYE